MKTKTNIIIVTVAVLISAICFFQGSRAYRRWRAKNYIEYRGAYLPRKGSLERNSTAPFEISSADSLAISKAMEQPMDAPMAKGLSLLLGSFLSAYGSTNTEEYIKFRFQETTESWTAELNAERFRTQIPMWPKLLNMSDIPIPPLSRLGELVEGLKQFKEDDGTPVFCLPCITSLQPQSVNITSFTTNTIDVGFRELRNATAVVSKTQGVTSKQTFLSYPANQVYPTVILSLMANTTRTKGIDIIVLQAIWLSGDGKWIPVGMGITPHSGYIAYPF